MWFITWLKYVLQRTRKSNKKPSPATVVHHSTEFIRFGDSSSSQSILINWMKMSILCERPDTEFFQSIPELHDAVHNLKDSDFKLKLESFWFASRSTSAWLCFTVILTFQRMTSSWKLWTTKNLSVSLHRGSLKVFRFPWCFLRLSNFSTVYYICHLSKWCSC